MGEQGNFYSQIEINRLLTALGLTGPALSGSHSSHGCILHQLSMHMVHMVSWEPERVYPNCEKAENKQGFLFLFFHFHVCILGLHVYVVSMHVCMFCICMFMHAEARG